MIRRLIFVIIYAVCLVPLVLSALLLPIMSVIALVLYVGFDYDSDRIFDFITAPFMFFVDLPYRIKERLRL